MLDDVHRRHGGQHARPRDDEARAGVLEFLLVNHPLDCPVCDKGGECPLQDFSYSFGPAASRMDFPRRVFDGEGVKADVDFGPTLMLNRNRCILCTRCVRFMREIDGDAQIGIVDRGNGSEIATFREEGVHSLLSGNLMDVCPVGAITTREYRFKSRPWDNPGVVDTICTLLLEGLQHQRVAQGQARMGAGLAAHSHDAASQSRRQQLLDVRHRPLRLPLGRRRDAPSPPADALAAPSSSRRRGTTSSRAFATAFSRPASADAEIGAVPRVGARGHRRALRAEADGRRPARSTTGCRRSRVTWNRREKPQPAGADVPDQCHRRAERERRARPRLRGRRGNDGPADLAALRTAVEGGRVKALYVVDPGPDGSIGDVSWIVAARRSGTLPLLIVQGVVMTDLGRGRRHRASGRGVGREGRDLHERPGTRAGGVASHRAAWRGARGLADPGRPGAVAWADHALPELERRAPRASPRPCQGRVRRGADSMAFARPVSASNWLQASNPSERWKWDFMYQDLPPVKGHNVQMEGAAAIRFIPLKPVE